MGVLELEDRKKFFFKTLKNKNWGKIIVNLILGVLFTLYFAQVLIYHNYFVSQINELNETIPLIFNRFRYSILSYSIMRERLMNNQSLASFEYDPVFGYNIDVMYNELSMDDEK